MNILWNKYKEKRNYKKLDNNIETDVLVIGGGICGLLCAYKLKEEGKKVVLVEKDRICNLRSLRTTAVVTPLQDFYYMDMKNSSLFLKANLKAIDDYLKLPFEFDLEKVPSYKYGYNKDELNIECDYIEAIGGDASMSIVNLNKEMLDAIKMDSIMFNPVKLAYNLSENLTIYENTKVIDIKKNIAYTDEYQIKAQKIIICTGYPFLKWKGMFFTKLNQKKSYVMVIDEKMDGFNAIGSNTNELYYRTYNDYLIIGGCDTKTGDVKDKYSLLRSKYKSENKLLYEWVNQDTMSLDDIPYIGNIDENLYVACGFNMWGMSGAMISADIIKDLILGKDNNFADFFKVDRHISLKLRMKFICDNIKEMLCFKKAKCSHLGCGLIWNENEKCYECPCHGSKYDENGQIIFGPADENLRKK